METFNNVYNRFLVSSSLSDKLDYLDFMLHFYKDVRIALKKEVLKPKFREQMSVFIQMMYSKGKTLHHLIKCSINENENHECIYIDHTILFTLVRSAYEQLCVFELVYMIPDTDEKRTIMENVYVAAGPVNRQKAFTEDTRLRYKEVVIEDEKEIDVCRTNIQNTNLFKSLSANEQKKIEDCVFKKGEYQILFTKEGKLVLHVGWDEVRKYSKLCTNALDGVYKYACNMAHPSYWGLIQFSDAYKTGGVEELNYTAAMQMIGIMSVFIMDFIEEFSEIKDVYSNLDEESKYMIRAYSECFRNKCL